LELHHAEEKGMTLGRLRKEKEGEGGVRLGGVWRKWEGGPGNAWCSRRSGGPVGGRCVGVANAASGR
jgi:hypothetical protein